MDTTHDDSGTLRIIAFGPDAADQLRFDSGEIGSGSVSLIFEIGPLTKSVGELKLDVGYGRTPPLGTVVCPR
jgi:hypothetical protein